MDPRRRTVLLRFLAEPSDINFGGKVHGGSVMKWIDQAAYTCAVGWSQRYAVTVSVSGIRFYRPIHVGDVVELEAMVIHTGRSSMHIQVKVTACNPRGDDIRETTRCVIVFVALDDAQQPVEVPAWVPQTDDDRALEQFAIRSREASQALEQSLADRT